jgi:hypothetical protein
MARIRTIKPEFQNSQSMGRVSRDARLLFIELWPQCDDAGRIRANSRMLASILFPYDLDAPGLINGWLSELEKEECIVRYQIGNDEYLQVLHWSHQKIDHPKASEIPPPPAKKPRKTKLSSREDSRGVANIRALSSTVSSTVPEGIGEDSAEPSALAPEVVRLPTNRFETRGEEVGYSQQQIDAYAGTFPAVDVPQQFRQMRQWLIDNREKRKTASGMGRFVNGWLTREQDKPKPKPANNSSPFPVAQILKVV